MKRLLLVLGFLALASGAAQAEAPWQQLKSKDGVRYEKRAVAGTKYFEHRALFFIAREPKDVQDAIWRSIESLHGPEVAARDVLRRGENELVMHDYIKTPIVSDRELTLRFEKIGQPPLAIRYLARNDLGPPPAPKRVVLQVVRGGWVIEPAPGGSQVTYDCYNEPGGSVPAWMVRGPQQDRIKEDVERLIKRLR